MSEKSMTAKDVAFKAYHILDDWDGTDETLAYLVESASAGVEAYAAERVKEAVAGHAQTIVELTQQAQEARDFAGIQGESMRDTVRHYGERLANERVKEAREKLIAEIKRRSDYVQDSDGYCVDIVTCKEIDAAEEATR